MPRNNLTTFRDIADKLEYLRIVCPIERDGRSRKGRYAVARLIEQYGLDAPLYEHIGKVTADCPRHGSADIYILCKAHSPDLPRVLMDGDVLRGDGD